MDGDGLFLNYKTSTIIAAAFVMLVFIILLILIGLEIRRMKKEDTLQIILEDKTADEKCKKIVRAIVIACILAGAAFVALEFMGVIDLNSAQKTEEKVKLNRMEIK
ncbi:MAG: hypothetical protein ACLTDF_08965 [Coprococcus sp.]